MLKFLHQSFLVAHYFFMCTWIEFIFGLMIDTGLKFLSAVSATMTVTLGSRSQTFKVFVLKFLGAHYFFTFGWI